MKAEEEDQIAEEARLKAEEYNRAHLNVEEEILLTFEARRKAEEEGELMTEI